MECYSLCSLSIIWPLWSLKENIINMATKQLTGSCILPLTIISFGTLTKWWYVLPVEAPDTMMVGFPLAFVSDGWHTSMSLQIFLFELAFDFLIYFLFWFLLILLIDRYLIKIKTGKIIGGILWTFSTVILSIAVFIASFPEHIFSIKRDWDRQVMVTGFKFTWTHQDRPNFSKYAPSKK